MAEATGQATGCEQRLLLETLIVFWCGTRGRRPSLDFSHSPHPQQLGTPICDPERESPFIPLATEEQKDGHVDAGLQSGWRARQLPSRTDWG